MVWPADGIGGEEPEHQALARRAERLGTASSLHSMGIYGTLILPGLLDWAMRNRQLGSYRRQTIGAARGLVIEIGSGLNIEAPSNWWTPLLSSGGSGKVSNEPGTAPFYG